MTALRSRLFNLAFFTWSVVMHLVTLPLFPGPPAAIYFMGWIWVNGTLFLLRTICGLSHRVVGEANIPAGAALIAAKHQSIWETLAFVAIFKRPIFIMKKELVSVPFYGWYLHRIGMIAIDRDGGTKAMRQMIAQTRDRLARGQHVIIFPEGTRTQPGEHRSFHPGVAALYRQLDQPVVPVALDSGLFWPGRTFSQRPGVITVEILPPIPPGLERRQFMARLEGDIQGASDRLAASRQAAAQ